MSFTEPKIEMHFEKMQVLSGNILKIAEQLQDMAGNAGMYAATGLKTAWMGENADIFVKKEVKLMNEISDIALDLQNISGRIEEKARLCYELEKLNVLTANARIY